MRQRPTKRPRREAWRVRIRLNTRSLENALAQDTRAANSSNDSTSQKVNPKSRDALIHRLRVDTGGHGDIRTFSYKSHHTTTPNGFDLQISATHPTPTS
jgi:hypothetical protein